MENSERKKLGFTLIETIMAIVIIALVIAATAQLTASSLRMGKTTMEHFQSLHLAEEGLEIVRNIRDSNWLQNKDFRSGLGDGMYAIGDGLPWKLVEIAGDENEKRVITIKSIDEKTMFVTSKVKSTELNIELTDWKKGPL